MDSRVDLRDSRPAIAAPGVFAVVTFTVEVGKAEREDAGLGSVVVVEAVDGFIDEVGVALDEKGVFGEIVPFVEDVVEVGITLSADIGNEFDHSSTGYGLDCGEILGRIFDVDCDRGI